MTNHARVYPDTTETHAEQHQPSVRNYVAVFVVLFAITMIEIAASYLTRLGFPAWLQIAALIALSAVKGALVVLFFMHLRFDSRWFSFLFTAGIILATFAIIILITLFKYRAGLSE